MMISDYSNRGTQIHFPAPFNSISGTFSSERYMDILDEQHEASKIEFLYPLADPRSLEKALKSIYDNKKFNFWEIITFKKNRYINDYNRLSANFRLEGFKTYHKSIKECVSKMIEYEKAIKNVKEELITYKYKILRVKFLVQMIHLENSIFEEEDVFLRDKLILISDSFRKKLKEVSHSRLTDNELVEIYNTWLEAILKVHEVSMKNLIDLSDITYNIDVINSFLNRRK